MVFKVTWTECFSIMKGSNKFYYILLASIFLIYSISIQASAKSTSLCQQTDPLASWKNGTNKKAIIDFVKMTTDKRNKNYVPPYERIATFDQDGTLWVEQPVYTQVLFAFDQIKKLAPKHPEWRTTEPFKTVLTHDPATISKLTGKDLITLITLTHTGTTPEEYANTVKHWLSEAKNPRWQRPYTDLVYQPMLELLRYLRAHGYKTYIVTGSGQDFVRVYSRKVYGIPAEQVIGSALKSEFFYDKNNHARLLRTNQLLLNNDDAHKAENIYLFIGRRSRVSFGNSNGDRQMLEYTQSGKGAHLLLLVHHDDDKREYSYGTQTKIGTFSHALMKEAKQNGWLVVSMKHDWIRIFSFDERVS